MRSTRRARSRPRLRLCTLEDRTAPATDTFTNAAGGSWATGSNWSLGAPPTAADDAVIMGLNGGATVTLSSGVTTPVHGLLVDATSTLTLSSGSTLSITGSGAIAGTLILNGGNSLTVPAGATLNVTSGAILDAVEGYPGTAYGITVDGVMNVAGATFNRAGSLGYTGSYIHVDAGGQLTASSSTFGWASLTLANGAVLNSGDITDNTFAQTITVPAIDVPLLANNQQFHDIKIQPGSLTNGQTTTFAPMGTVNSATQRYVLNAATGNFIVQSGATLNVTAGAVLDAAEAYPGTAYGITVNGTMNVAGATFTRDGSLGYTGSFLAVSAGGHLTAGGTTFGWAGLSLATGAVLNGGDITGNTFNQTITVPAIDVPLLANNVSFQDIVIQPGGLNSGQNVTFAQMGTANTGLQRYVFNAATGNFNIHAGATLNVTAGAIVDAAEAYPGSAYGITVNGSMNVSAASFTRDGSLGYTGSFIQVNAGGHLTAANSTLGWASLTLANGSVLNAGDITGNTFPQPITIPAADATLLANNKSFQDVNIQPGSIGSGQTVTLSPIGTITTQYQRYVFSAATGNFIVQAGATLNVTPGTSIVGLEAYPGTAYGITVNGTMNVTQASFTRIGSLGYNGSFITVSANGHLTAVTSTFAWAALSLANGAILNNGDIVDNTFNQTITIPAMDAALLANNRQFQDIDIQPGTLTSGQNAILAPMGTVTTTGQQYVFSAATGNFVVQSGATLDVTDGAIVEAVEAYPGTAFGITVNGIMNVAPTASFYRGGSLGYTGSYVTVANGGSLTAISSSVIWSNLNFNSGSKEAIQFTALGNKITINSGATIDIALDDLSAVGSNGVVAAGPSTATIDLRNNFWGTTDPTAIAAKIHDHVDDATLPTVLFNPFLNTPDTSFFDPAGMPLAVAGVAFNQTIAAVGGTGPASNFTVSSGTLPAGLTLGSDGTLSGTPTQAGAFTFTVSADDYSASNGNFTARQLYWLYVDAPQIVITPATLPDTQSGVFYNQSLGASGGTPAYGPFTLAGGALPTGLSLAADGTLSGTPTVDGTFNFLVTAQDSTTGPAAPYSGSRVYTIVVDDTPPAAGTVSDGLGADVNFQASGSTISANWTGFVDSGSGIAGYQWAVGTTPGGTDVKAYSSVGLATHATATGLSLVDGTRYYVSVEATDSAGNVSNPATSDGVTVDTTPPIIGSVNDGPGTDIDSQSSTTTISANWTGFADAVSGIAGYQWAIGTTPGGTDVQGFTSVGLATGATNAGLSLTQDQTYYVTVKATDAVGNVSGPAKSDGVTVAPPAPAITGYSIDSGAPGDGVTNDNTPTLSGTAAANATIRVYDGATPLGQTTAAGDGSWQLTTPALPDGNHALTATATDAGGVTSDPSAALDLTSDTKSPDVTVSVAAGQADPTNAGPILFAVHFSEPVVGFGAAAVRLTGSTVGGTLSASVSGSGPDYTVSVTGMDGTGTVVVTIPALAVTDVAGNPNTASTGATNSVTFDNQAPTVTVSPVAGQPDPVESGPVQFAVQFSEPVTGFGPAGVSLAGSTVGGSLSVSVSGSGTDYTVSVTGMFGAGTVVVGILPGAAVDAAGNGNTASTGGSGGTGGTANYNGIGRFQFVTAGYSTNEEAGTVVLTVHRVGGADGSAQVDYATADGTATAGSDYTGVSGTLNWGDGDTSDRTITVPITQDTVNEGRESFAVTLTPQGAARPGSPASATVTIAPSDGAVINGSDKKPQATITDADGDLIAIKLGGKVGTLTYYLTNGQGPIAEIDLTGTDPAKSTITVTVTKPKGGTGDGLAAVGEVDGTGFKSFGAKKSDINGAGFNLSGAAGAIAVHVIEDGANVTVGGPLGKLSAVAIGTGTITAPSVGTIAVTGQKATATQPFIAGDLKADVTISGTGVDPKKGKALKGLTVAGAVTGSTVSVGGNVGAVTVGSFLTSRLFAGYDGSGTFTQAATVGPFAVKAPAGGFADSDVVATSLKAVTLASATTTGAAPFGFTFRGSAGGTFAGLTVKSPQLVYNKKAGGSQVLADQFGVTDV